jgi:uncharacterized repeat protein (TIGR03803 family)
MKMSLPGQGLYEIGGAHGGGAGFEVAPAGAGAIYPPGYGTTEQDCDVNAGARLALRDWGDDAMRQASLITALLLAICAAGAHATDSYDPATRSLTMPSVVVGNTTFSAVVVVAGAMVSGPVGAAPNQHGDSFDPATGQLSLAAVTVDAKTFYNTVITVEAVQSIGNVVDADIYDGAELIVPSVQVIGGAVYHNVALTLGGLTSIAGGLPRNVQDVYDPSSQQLTIAAVQFGTRVYTNAVVSVGTVVSVGGAALAETILQTMVYSLGSGPMAALIQGADGNFYGTTSIGGAGNSGTVFKVTPVGTMTVLYNFGIYGSGDAQQPHASLLQGSDGNLYGTTLYGGAYNNGAVFRITPNGAESVLHSFSGGYSEVGHGLAGSNDGATPWAALIEGRRGDFYGVTGNGGIYNAGTVFKITSSGEETQLYSFSGGSSGIAGSTDGVGALGTLFLGSDGNFYGTTLLGGAYNGGTVYRVTADGVETVIHSFSGGGALAGSPDGAAPFSSLVEGKDGSFYGTTSAGGTYNAGTVFKITGAGVETVLYSFTGGLEGLSGSKDGAYPTSGLIIASDGNLYGTTYNGGAYDVGSVYKLTPAGAETVLYSFTGLSTAVPGGLGINIADGTNPWAGLLEGRDGNLYGTTQGGGSESSNGTVFRLSDAVSSP